MSVRAMLRVGKKREEEFKRVYSGTRKELFSLFSSVPSLHSFSSPFWFLFFTSWRVSVCRCCARRWRFCAWAPPAWRPAAGAKQLGERDVSVAAGSHSRVWSLLKGMRWTESINTFSYDILCTPKKVWWRGSWSCPIYDWALKIQINFNKKINVYNTVY